MLLALVGALFSLVAMPGIAWAAPCTTITSFTAMPLNNQQSIQVSNNSGLTDGLYPCDPQENGIIPDSSTGNPGTFPPSSAVTVNLGGAYTYTGAIPGTFSTDNVNLFYTPTFNPGVGYAVALTVYVSLDNGADYATAETILIEVPASNPTTTQVIASKALTQNQPSASFTPVAGSGGTAPLAYSVSPPLPPSLSMASTTGTITGTPSVTSSATTYTVTVTDANSATATQTFTLTVKSAVTATQAIASTSLTVNHAATAFTPVTGSGGTAPLTYGVSPGLPTGLGLSTSTGAITGTPTVTSSATTYTVTVTDANSVTATATFVLTVNPPAPTVAAVAPAFGSAAGGTSVTITGTDFTGATSVTIGGAAATSLTVVNATTITVVTPAGAAEPASILVTTEGGTNSANALYTYVSTPIVGSIAPSSGPTAGGTAVTITGSGFAAGETYTATFGAAAVAATYTSATTLTATTPSGSGAATVTVRDTRAAINATGSATFTYLAAPVAGTVTASVAFNSTANPIILNLSGGPAGSVAVTTPASHGTATASGTAITYTPTTGYNGSDSFQYTATNAGGTSAPASVTITVNKAAPTVTVQASAPTITFGVSETLTATVSGGVTPTGSVTFKDGATALATVSLSGSTAVLKISSLGTGAHSITAVYNGDGNNSAAASGAAAITVNARPNPALNPDVVGITTAEVSTATRFGRTQLQNVGRRLEEIHDEDDEDAPGGQLPPPRDPRRNRLGGSALPDAPDGQTDTGAARQQASLDARNPYGALPSAFGMHSQTAFGDFAGTGQPLAYADTPAGLAMRQDGQNQSGRAIQALSSIMPAAIAALNKRADLPFHIWFAGAVDFGTVNADGSYNNRFSTSGLTIGIDRRLFNGFKAGVAVGMGIDRTEVGTDGTTSNAVAYNATIYASYRFLPHTFLDAVAGYGRVNFSLDRYSADGNVMLTGNRTGSDVFGSVSLTQDVKMEAWKFSPYTRLDVIHVDLAAYGENGSSTWNLSYNELTSTNVYAVLGTRIGYAIPQRWGTVTPMLRMEYSHALTGSFSQTLSYAGLPGTNYVFTATPEASDLFTGGLILHAETFDGLGANIEYLLSGTTRELQGQQIRLSVRQAF